MPKPANHRRFVATGEHVPGGATRRVYRLTCRRCDGTEPSLTHNNGKGLPTEGITKAFQHKGWTVGKRPQDDVCPECNGYFTRKGQLAPAPVNVEGAMGKVSELQGLQAAAPIVMAEKPKEPGIAEILLILGTLESVYDPKAGYSKGESDATVAATLNCPRAWVQQVRRQKFGDTAPGSNPEAAELLADVQACLERGDKLRLELAGDLLRIDEEKRTRVGQLEGLNGEMKRLRDRLLTVERALK